MIQMGISEVAEETGIHASSLRRWESLGFIARDRVSFRNTWVRLYSIKDIELLKRVKELMDAGYRLRPAFDRARQEIEEEE